MDQEPFWKEGGLSYGKFVFTRSFRLADRELRFCEILRDLPLFGRFPEDRNLRWNGPCGDLYHDHRFRLDLKIKEHLGSFEKNTLNLYAETLGGKNAECPVYLDEIKVHETVTDAMVTALTLVK